nr:hypothetical protein [PVC group bacterium]
MLTTLLIASALFADPLLEVETSSAPLHFSVTHDGVGGDEVSGRIYIMLTKGKTPLIGGPNWMRPEPFFALDVEDWEKNTPLIISDNSDNMSGPPQTIGEGPWKAVAILRRNPDTSRLASFGGLYGESVSFDRGGSTAGKVKLTINNLVPERDWKLHKNLRLIETKSELLSGFFG